MVRSRKIKKLDAAINFIQPTPSWCSQTLESEHSSFDEIDIYMITHISNWRQVQIVGKPRWSRHRYDGFCTSSLFLLHEKKIVMGLDGVLSHWIVFLRQYFQSKKRSEEMNRTQAQPNNRRIQEVFLHRSCALRERWKLSFINTNGPGPGPGGDKFAVRAALTGRESGAIALLVMWGLDSKI